MGAVVPSRRPAANTSRSSRRQPARWVARLEVAALCGGFASGLLINGVSPSDAAKYAAASSSSLFRCFDSSLEVPVSSVNDNYCDCADGSDEPGTAACAGLSSGRFYCRNQRSSPKILYSSRVGDGICDCCDGSDEGPAACNDTCDAEEAAAKADRDRRRALILESLRIVQESHVNATADVASWRAELEGLEKEMTDLKTLRQAAEARRAAAQATVDPVRLAAVEAGLILFEDDFEAPGAAEGWSLAEGGSGKVVQDADPARGSVLSMQSCTWGGDSFSRAAFNCTISSKCRISFWARGAPWQGVSQGIKRTETDLEDAHSWLAVPTENKQFSDRLAATKSSDVWQYYDYLLPSEDKFQMFGSEQVRPSTTPLHLMVQAHGSTGYCSETAFDEFIVRKDTAVNFKDSDGDKVAFTINSQGGLDVYSNDEKVVTNIAGLYIDGRHAIFGEHQAEVAEGQEAVLAEVQYLFSKRSQSGSTSKAASDAARGRQTVQPTATQAAGKPEVSEYAKWALQQEKREQPAATEGDAAAPSSEDEQAAATAAVAQEDIESGVEDNRSQAERDLDAARAELDGAEKKIRETEERMQLLKTGLNNVGPDLRWYLLLDACASKSIDGFSYKICHFDDAKQDMTSLGSFDSWDPDNLVMRFTGGDFCGDIARKLRVQLECGPAHEILSVWEPSMCDYDARVTHPTACSQAELASLEDAAKRVITPHDEL
eukprot:TRINITY_DN28495_c0_g1_i4.p1 TRINITY_DN28495_c0_g1~~TRINITY_DN28495_c0_g1_i4.p1  ORF type:complete len:716 (-),score=152.37 TRINITY_DN28495_c0_g1_i4:105-2252(-)